MKKQLLKLLGAAGFHQPEIERLGIEDKFEKFAELIVKECADIASINQFQHDAVGNYVLKHFGIEK